MLAFVKLQWKKRTEFVLALVQLHVFLHHNFRQCHFLDQYRYHYWYLCILTNTLVLTGSAWLPVVFFSVYFAVGTKCCLERVVKFELTAITDPLQTNPHQLPLKQLTISAHAPSA